MATTREVFHSRELNNIGIECGLVSLPRAHFSPHQKKVGTKMCNGEGYPMTYLERIVRGIGLYNTTKDGLTDCPK